MGAVVVHCAHQCFNTSSAVAEAAAAGVEQRSEKRSDERTSPHVRVERTAAEAAAWKEGEAGIVTRGLTPETDKRPSLSSAAAAGAAAEAGTRVSSAASEQGIDVIACRRLQAPFVLSPSLVRSKFLLCGCVCATLVTLT